MRQSEQDMILGCIKGNLSSQKQLYEQFAGKMLAVCMRYAKDRAEAEDMLQEAFLKVYQNISKFKNEGSFEGWVRRIMVFSAINYYKQRSRKFKEDLDQPHLDFGYKEEIIDRISAKEILELVQQMPEGYQLIFNLFAIEGFSHKEIAAELGIAIGTSKSQYARAKVYMQNLLAKHNQIRLKPHEDAR
jgi:RNA polymerase sigma-70 factor (ECF subfamily)